MEQLVDKYQAYLTTLEDSISKTIRLSDLQDALNLYDARGKYTRQFVQFIRTWGASEVAPAGEQ